MLSAKLAPNSQKCCRKQETAENKKHVEKETLRHSKFIADSSPLSNKAGMRESVRQRNTGASSLYGKYAPTVIAGG
jgi:hypothetical protein